MVINDSDIKKYKDVLLDMLIDFDKFCLSNDIEYSLDSGTLLGAVRHSGFIPWDDDIDVIMTKENYQKFLDKKDDYFSKYAIVCPFDDSLLACPRALKIFSKNCCIMEKGIPYYEGAFIDVFFTMDVKHKSKFLNGIYLNKYKYLCRMYEYKTKRMVLVDETGFLSRLAFINSFFVSKKYLKKKILKYHNFVRNNSFCTSSFGSNNKMRKSFFTELILHPFEKHSFPIAKEYDDYLHELYGEYTILPSEKDRQCKHLVYLAFDENYEERQVSIDE